MAVNKHAWQASLAELICHHRNRATLCFAWNAAPCYYQHHLKSPFFLTFLIVRLLARSQLLQEPRVCMSACVCVNDAKITALKGSQGPPTRWVKPIKPTQTSGAGGGGRCRTTFGTRIRLNSQEKCLQSFERFGWFRSVLLIGRRCG